MVVYVRGPHLFVKLTVCEHGNSAVLQQVVIGSDQGKLEDLGGREQETIRWIAVGKSQTAGFSRYFIRDRSFLQGQRP